MEAVEGVEGGGRCEKWDREVGREEGTEGGGGKRKEGRKVGRTKLYTYTHEK